MLYCTETDSTGFNGEDPGPAAEQAQGLATTVTKQTETLYGEVARFLSTTKGA